MTCRYTCSRLRIESNPIQYGINGQLDQSIKRVVRRDGCRDERLKKEGSCDEAHHKYGINVLAKFLASLRSLDQML